MNDQNQVPHPITRPKLLMQAARIALMSSSEPALLRRAFGGVVPQKTNAALQQVMDLEAELDDRRKKGRGDYAPTRHVDILAALLALLRKRSMAAS